MRNKISLVIILFFSVLSGCTESHHVANGVNVAQYSNDGALVAAVRSGKDEHTLIFSLFRTDEGGVVTSNEINVPSGYHAPTVTIAWKSANVVRVTIDHDFGEGSHVYEYDSHNDLFKRR